MHDKAVNGPERAGVGAWGERRSGGEVGEGGTGVRAVRMFEFWGRWRGGEEGVGEEEPVGDVIVVVVWCFGCWRLQLRADTVLLVRDV